MISLMMQLWRNLVCGPVLNGDVETHIVAGDEDVHEWSFNEYQSEALKTADCPLIGHPIVYPFLGVVGEFGEVYEKLIYQIQPDMSHVWSYPVRGEIIKEIGDVLWYIAVMADRLGVEMQTLSLFDTESLTLYAINTSEVGEVIVTSNDIQATLNDMAISVGRLGERVKKLFRDGCGDVSGDRRDDLIKELSGVLWCLASLCRLMQIDFSFVAHTNIQKLHSRRQRNAIRGEGDNR